MIRMSPSTCSVSFASALMLSFPSAFVTTVSKWSDSSGRTSPPSLDHRLGIDAGVPEVEVAASRELGHGLAVRGRTARPPTVPMSLVEPRERPASTKLVARRFTSHSNGPGLVSSKSLMSKTIARSGAANPPKFARCASPQALDLQSRSGGRAEIGRHDDRGAAVERERRREHPMMTNLDKISNPCLLLGSKQGHGIRSSVSRRPGGVAGAGDRASCCPADGDAFLDAQHRDRFDGRGVRCGVAVHRHRHIRALQAREPA